jgi:hypothetical protein
MTRAPPSEGRGFFSPPIGESKVRRNSCLRDSLLAESGMASRRSALVSHVRVRTGIDRTRRRPDSARGKPIHRLRAHSKTWRAAGCSWRSKYSGWKAKKFPCLKPKNNGIAHAGDCNHFDRRARNRLRSPLVGVSPKPLTTTTATSVLIADSPTLSFHASGASFTVPKSPSELTAIRLVAESASLVPANRRPTPKVAHRRGFSLEALAAN